MNQQPYQIEPRSQFETVCGIPLWMNFAALTTIVCILPAIAATMIANEDYLEFWRTPKYFEPTHLWITLATAIALGVGFSVTSSSSRHFQSVPLQRTDALNSWATAAVCLTIFGYVVWYGAAISRGLRLWHVVALLSGSEQGLIYSLRREQMETISGITTMTQFGTAAIILTLLSFPDRPYVRRVIISALLGLAALRALLNSERLAIIELAIPALIVLIRLLLIGRPISAKLQLRLMIAPVALALGVFLLFMGMESLRSWSHYSKINDSLLAFSAARFGGYYITSLNNGALSFDMLETVPFPYFLLMPLWKFPLIESSAYSYTSLTRTNPDENLGYLLETYANLEFNNPCGIFLPFIDFGMIGGFVVMITIGVICGFFYTSFKLSGLMGLLFYPTAILFAMDLPRLFYYSMPRNLPTLVFLLLVLVFCGVRYQLALMHCGSIDERE